MFHAMELAYPERMFTTRIAAIRALGKRLRNTANTTRQMKAPHSTWNRIDCECESSTENTGLTTRNKSVSESPAKKNATSVTAINTSAVLKSGCLSTSAKGTMNSRAGTANVLSLNKLTGCLESQNDMVSKYAIFANSEGCNLKMPKSIHRPAPFTTSPAKKSTMHSSTSDTT